MQRVQLDPDYLLGMQLWDALQARVSFTTKNHNLDGSTVILCNKGPYGTHLHHQFTMRLLPSYANNLIKLSPNFPVFTRIEKKETGTPTPEM